MTNEEIKYLLFRVNEEELAKYLLVNNLQYARNLYDELKKEIREQVETLPLSY